MINIIITICHLTPNEAVDEPQPSDFVALMRLLETLIEHSSRVSSERLRSSCNKSPMQKWVCPVPIPRCHLGFSPIILPSSLALPVLATQPKTS